MKTFRTVGFLVVIAAIVVVAYLYMKDANTDGGAMTVSPTPLADDMVVLYEPLPGQKGISSPLTVRGKARGTWFFEASFPVTLTDSQGRILVAVPAQAKTDWMTSDFVEFEATLVFTTPTTGTNQGTLTLQKDNPSGLPEHDDHREVTVYFAQ